ncbi:MAG TPA: hypothetical protein VN873_15680 [Candidatus Angelobacter sp.]|nr:hypothetical protein [Candidatus Angelobacter sp.]
MKQNLLKKAAFVVSLALLFGCSSLSGRKALDIVNRAPTFAGYRYRCGEMVNAINGLRHLGKPKAIQILRQYAVASEMAPLNQEKVELICMLLFVNPDGWNKIPLGPRVS